MVRIVNTSNIRAHHDLRSVKAAAWTLLELLYHILSHIQCLENGLVAEVEAISCQQTFLHC